MAENRLNRVMLAGKEFLPAIKVEVRDPDLFSFKGYVSTTAPNPSSGLTSGDLWINSSVMPTAFPVSPASLRAWNGDEWDYDDYWEYTPKALDAFMNLNNNCLYFWFDGQWRLLTTDLHEDDFYQDAEGKWHMRQDSPVIEDLQDQIDNNAEKTEADLRELTEKIEQDLATKANVSLDNLDEAGQKKFDDKADLESPTFTGNPKAPTQARGTHDDTLANTSFVADAIAALVDSAPSTLDTLQELAAALGNDPNFATTIMNMLASKANTDLNNLTSAGQKKFDDKANVNSPNFTGTPTVPTAGANTSNGQIASTQFVHDVVNASGKGVPGKERIDLTLQSSGATYVAPANGFVCIRGQTNNTGYNTTASIESSLGIGVSYYGQPTKYESGESHDNRAGSFYLTLPIAGGDTFKVYYNTYFVKREFFFVHAA